MARATLTYDKMFYTMYGLNSDNWTEKAMRAEYSRLRSIARKRLERFEGTEFTDSKTYAKNAGKFKPLKEISGITELKRQLSDVAFFVDASTGSVTGLRKKRDAFIQTMRERGYDFINKSNYRDFTEFMDESINQKLASVLDSEQLAEVYSITREKKIPSDALFKDFMFWYKNRYALENMPELFTKSGKPASAAMYRKALLEKMR